MAQTDRPFVVCVRTGFGVKIAGREVRFRPIVKGVKTSRKVKKARLKNATK